MTKETFIEKLKGAVIPMATTGLLSNIEKPPGRKPDAKTLQLSEWLNSLSDVDRQNVEEMIKQATAECLFGVCAVLDGVRVVDENTDHFELNRIDYSGKEEALSGALDYHDLC